MMSNKIKSSALNDRSSSHDKKNHIRICLEKNVESSLTNGFEKYYLINNPLPDLDFKEVDTSCTFLGKAISAPFIISPITGGYENSAKINRNLAKSHGKF